MYDINQIAQLPAQVLGYIIRTKMSLPQANVFLRDQNVKIPGDNGVYVVVGLINAPTPLSAVTYLKSTPVTPTTWDTPDQQWDSNGNTWDNTTAPSVIEINEVQLREDIQIDFMSRSNAGFQRNWEVIAALNSIFSQQMQERFNFKIARLPRGFVNTSYAEGGSQLNRYTLTFSCLTWYRKETPLTSDGQGYYDSFETRVDDAATIGTETPLIEFEIPGVTLP